MTKKLSSRQIFAIFCFVGAALFCVHQFIFYNVLFELKDASHHEFFIGVLLAFGVGLLVAERSE